MANLSIKCTQIINTAAIEQLSTEKCNPMIRYCSNQDALLRAKVFEKQIQRSSTRHKIDILLLLDFHKIYSCIDTHFLIFWVTLQRVGLMWLHVQFRNTLLPAYLTKFSDFLQRFATLNIRVLPIRRAFSSSSVHTKNNRVFSF